MSTENVEYVGVQASANDVAAATDIVLSVNLNVAVGDYLLACVTVGTNSDIVGTPAGWTRLTGLNNPSGAALRQDFFERWATSDDLPVGGVAKTYAWTRSASARHNSQMLVVRDTLGLSGTAGQAVSASSTTSFTLPSCTAAVPGCLTYNFVAGYWAFGSQDILVAPNNAEGPWRVNRYLSGVRPGGRIDEFYGGVGHADVNYSMGSGGPWAGTSLAFAPLTQVVPFVGQRTVLTNLTWVDNTPVPKGVVNGDLMLLLWQHLPGSDPPSITGWTLEGTRRVGTSSSDTAVTLFSRIANNEPAVYAVPTYTGSGTRTNRTMLVYRDAVLADWAGIATTEALPNITGAALAGASVKALVTWSATMPSGSVGITPHASARVVTNRPSTSNMAQAIGEILTTNGVASLAAVGSGNAYTSTVSFAMLLAEPGGVSPQFVEPTGIASAEAFGTAEVAAGAVLPALVVAPTSIASAEALGSLTIARAQLVVPVGIASGQAFGTAVVTVAPSAADPVVAIAASASPHLYVYRHDRVANTQVIVPAAAPLPGAPAQVAWSPDNRLLAVPHGGAPYFTLMSWDGTTLVALPNIMPTTGVFPGHHAAWTPSGSHLMVLLNGGQGSNDQLFLFRRDGLTTLTLVWQSVGWSGDDLPAVGHGMEWDSTGTLLAVAHSGSPYVSVYQRTGDTMAKIAVPAAPLAGNGRSVSWDPAMNYLVVSHDTAPRITVFEWTGTALINPATPTGTLPSANPKEVQVHPSGEWFVVASAGGTPEILLYQMIAGVPTYVAITAPDQGTQVNDLEWSPDGLFLSVASGNTPRLSTYAWNPVGPSLTRMTNPATSPPLPTSVSYGMQLPVTTGVIKPFGISSDEAFGTPVVSVPPVISPSGIVSAEAFGNATITVDGSQTISVSGLESAEAFGTHEVRLPLRVIEPTGVGSAEAFGTPIIASVMSLVAHANLTFNASAQLKAETAVIEPPAEVGDTLVYRTSVKMPTPTLNEYGRPS